MHVRVPPGVEDGKEDQTQATNDCKRDRKAGQDLLRSRIILGQATPVSQPAFSDERDVEDYYHDRRPSDEERLSP